MTNKIAGDSIDFIQSEWNRRLPDLDVSHLDIVGRFARISSRVSGHVETNLAKHGLAWETFDLLITIYRWENRPGGVRPTDLYEECLLSSGAMAKRLSHAQKEGYINRQPDPDDGRASRITLTERGRQLAEEALPTHIATVKAVTSTLGKRDHETLVKLLRSLLTSLETPE